MHALYFFVRGQGQLLLYAYKMGVHWNFQSAIKMVDNRDKMSKYKIFKEMLSSIIKSLILSIVTEMLFINLVKKIYATHANIILMLNIIYSMGIYW